VSVAGLIEAALAHAVSAGMPVGYAVTVAVATCAALTAVTSRSAGGPLGPVRYLAERWRKPEHSPQTPPG
jgi:hypothetical protein